MSSFDIDPNFDRHLARLDKGIRTASQIGMRKVMRQAEKDAKTHYRWRKPGNYTETDSAGTEWTWKVTGFAAKTIKGLVLTSNEAEEFPELDGGTSTVTRRWADGREAEYEHVHETDASLYTPEAVGEDEIVGTLTMFAAYAPYLQAKEIEGGSWGTPGPGLPVIIEVLETHWESFYIPSILTPHIERAMDAIANSL